MPDQSSVRGLTPTKVEEGSYSQPTGVPRAVTVVTAAANARKRCIGAMIAADMMSMMILFQGERGYSCQLVMLPRCGNGGWPKRSRATRDRTTKLTPW